MNYLKSSLSKWLDRLMSSELCLDASKYMIVAEMYAGLLYGEQTDVSSAANLRLRAEGK